MRDYGNELTEKIQIRVSPEMKAFLQHYPGGYGALIREFVTGVMEQNRQVDEVIAEYNAKKVEASQ